LKSHRWPHPFFHIPILPVEFLHQTSKRMNAEESNAATSPLKESRKRTILSTDSKISLLAFLQQNSTFSSRINGPIISDAVKKEAEEKWKV
jgi:hypothetical protein